MKKILLLLFSIFLLGCGVVFWFYSSSQAPSNDDTKYDFLITKGSSASQVGSKLESGGFIKSSLAFKLYVQLTGKQRFVQAGEFSLSKNSGLFGLVETLLKGPSEIWVTIPEGLRREEVVDKFQKTLSKDEAFREEFLSLTVDKEGYLFPETYLFPKTASASLIVNKMLSTFESMTSELDLTRNEVILASLLERETITEEEKPIVAGILNNRLEIGMALQVDATIQYAKGDWEPITVADKTFDSRYNTYKYPGLPPGPIASPGLGSLIAVDSPAETDYLYYLHDSKGKIYYGRTLDEHNQNINKYLR